MPVIGYHNAAQRNPGKSSYLLPPKKKNFEHPPRAPHCSDRAQISTNVSGRSSPVKAFSRCPNGARTKRYGRKQIRTFAFFAVVPRIYDRNGSPYVRGPSCEQCEWAGNTRHPILHAYTYTSPSSWLVILSFTSCMAGRSHVFSTHSS